MNDLYKNILLKLLEAIDYSDDKDSFTDEFLKNVQHQTFINLVQALPQDKQEELKNEITNAGENPEIVKKYFTEEQIQKAFENASKGAVAEWMQAVNPTLSGEQRQNLLKLSTELNPTPPSASAV